jgi:hypothetical protein
MNFFIIFRNPDPDANFNFHIPLAHESGSESFRHYAKKYFSHITFRIEVYNYTMERQKVIKYVN